MSLTQQLVDLSFREEQDPGPPAAWQPLTDEDYAALAEKLTEEIGDEPLWIFAYGSLIWKPGFDSVASQKATAYGWHRSFSLHIERGRGSPTQPGLMMMLSRGGRCDGVIYRVADHDKRGQIESALRREVSHKDSLSTFRFMPVRTGDGDTIRALTFWAGGDSRGSSALCCRWNRWRRSWRAPAVIGDPAPNISTIPSCIWPNSAFATAISGACRRWWRARYAACTNAASRPATSRL
ncbi:ChaC-like protein [Rhizobium sp. NFR07]|nr:ChaC-like protein [Rhizobium sp. NFR07]